MSTAQIYIPQDALLGRKVDLGVVRVSRWVEIISVTKRSCRRLAKVSTATCSSILSIVPHDMLSSDQLARNKC